MGGLECSFVAFQHINLGHGIDYRPAHVTLTLIDTCNPAPLINYTWPMKMNASFKLVKWSFCRLMRPARPERDADKSFRRPNNRVVGWPDATVHKPWYSQKKEKKTKTFSPLFAAVLQKSLSFQNVSVALSGCPPGLEAQKKTGRASLFEVGAPLVTSQRAIFHSCVSYHTFWRVVEAK